MMKLHFSIFILLLVSFSNCNRKTSNDNTSKPAYDNEVPELPRFIKSFVDSDTLANNTDTLLYFQKSACFGFCPTFNYTIYQNGLIRYEGIQHVNPVGTKYQLITEDWWKEIELQIVSIKFFDLENVYPLEEKMYIPDLPNTIIVLKLYGKRKEVIDNHNAPKELKDFEIYLEQKLRLLKMQSDE